MRQILLTEGDLLDKDGNLCQAGYAFGLVKKYSRDAVKASKMRIKEWDYYYVGNQEYGVALTVADNSYMSMASASLMDFKNKKFVTDSEIKLFSNGKLRLPSSSLAGDVIYESKRVKIKFVNFGDRRQLVCSFDKWGAKKSRFACRFELTDMPSQSMVIATPFDKKAHFYYNQKINCMTAEGYFSIDGQATNMSGQAVLDWGRGVWTYKNTWYWSSLSCDAQGRKFGFNLGYGFGCNDAATENMLFVDGKAHKLNDVVFNIPKTADGKDDFLSEWTVTSDDHRLNLRFEPILDRNDKISLGVLATDQHQVFGRFFGDATLDDGETVTLNGQIGFAEKVFNKW